MQSAVVLIGLSFLALALELFYDEREVLFESQESKSTDGAAVFNKIRYISQGKLDIWMMQQSHHGVGAADENWDRLAIVVDKSKKPYTARFLQLEPGPLEWREDIPQRPFRVSCFVCHANGLRAVRPEPNSTTVRVSLWGQIKIASWNLRIKTYGRMQPHSNMDIAEPTSPPPHIDTREASSSRPFRLSGELENEELSVKTCKTCHSDDGFLARGPLMRQHTNTIRFMVESGHMPPPGFSLSVEERRQLEKFLHGL